MADGAEERARCCVAGGGPAGMMLGVLLARAGVDVVVLEKHADFLSDFRGNDRPMLLPLETVDDGTLVFHSQTLDFLKVLARIERDCLRLQVLHHDRLHVEIHLRRAGTGTEDEAGACPWPVPVSENQ